MGQHDRAFAEQLRGLIATVHPAGRGPYSYREIARGVTGEGVPMTSTTVYQLATGARANPKKHQVEGLAAFFGVPVTYFFDPAVAAGVDEQIAAVRVWRDTEAQSLALRTLALDETDRAAVDAFLTTLERRRTEGHRLHRGNDYPR